MGEPQREVGWNPPIPEAQHRLWVPIRSPKPGEPVSGILLATPLVSANVHWSGRREWPCVGRVVDCVPCQTQRPRWKGWFLAWDERDGRYVLLELTAYTMRHCQALRSAAADLAGRKLTLTRAGRKRNAPVVAALGTEVEPRYRTGPNPVKLPRPINVEEVLKRIWFAPSKKGD